VILQHGTVADVAGVGVRDMGPVMGVEHDANLIIVDIVLQGLSGPFAAVVDGVVEVACGAIFLEVKSSVKVVVAVNGHVRFTASVAIHDLGVTPRRASWRQFGMPQFIVFPKDVNDVDRTV